MSTVFEIGPATFTGNGTPDSDTVIIYYGILEPSFSEEVLKMFESPISEAGTRTWKYKGRHATFEVLVHLHKYDLATKPSISAWHQSAKAMAKKLISYYNQDVTFYPFYDSGNALPIKDSADAVVYCRLMHIDFNFLKKPGNAYDICTLTFKTNKFYDINKIILT